MVRGLVALKKKKKSETGDCFGVVGQSGRRGLGFVQKVEPGNTFCTSPSRIALLTILVMVLK